MTEKQRQLLRFIERYQTACDGVSPTVREMSAALDGASLSSIQRMIASLAEQGRVRRSVNRSRSVTVIHEHPDLSGVATELLLAEIGRRSVGAASSTP